MIEEQLRDGLRAAVTQEPPLGFDPDELADTARRTAHRRRASWATAAVAAIVAVGAIGAVATFGRAGGPGVEPGARGGGMTEVSAANDARDLGRSLVDAVSSVEPKADLFEVFAERGATDGVVTYEVEGKSAALAYWVRDCEPVARVDGCGYTSVHNHLQQRDAGNVRIASVVSDGVLLNVATGTRMTAMEATASFVSSNLKDCVCRDTELAALSRQQLDRVVEYSWLALFDPGERELTPGELKRRAELERQRAELEAERAKAEAERAKLNAEKAGGK